MWVNIACKNNVLCTWLNKCFLRLASTYAYVCVHVYAYVNVHVYAYVCVHVYAYVCYIYIIHICGFRFLPKFLDLCPPDVKEASLHTLSSFWHIDNKCWVAWSIVTKKLFISEDNLFFWRINVKKRNILFCCK